VSRTLAVRLTDALCLLYAAGVALVCAMRALWAVWPPWLVLLNSFTPWLFAPLLFMLIFGVVTRAKIAPRAALALLVVFVILYGLLFLPKPAAADTLGGITVMTFNLGPGVSQPSEIADAIAAEDADIIVMQELTLPAATAVRTKLHSRYPYGLSDTATTSRGILSRYPIQTLRWLRTGVAERATPAVQFSVDNHSVTLFAPHLPQPVIRRSNDLHLPDGMDTTEHDAELTEIVHWAQQATGTVLLAGDFNMSDQAKAYTLLSSNFRDAYREAGWGFGFTFPNRLRSNPIPVPIPVIRIDYIFHSPDLVAQAARVECKGGSDHCYLVAHLAWR
jgi:endonuclease/exonuclease/phosphatase (EEP) superfamily protein YafD